MQKSDLKKFCSTENYRTSLQNPWTDGGYTYATNGHILIKVPEIKGVTSNSKAPNAAIMFMEQFKKNEACFKISSKKLPKNLSQEEECPMCDGLGREHDCPECTCECEECNSTGIITKNSDDDFSVEIGGVHFALNYIRMLSELPECYIPKFPDKEKPMPFWFGENGEGLLMPMRGSRRNNLSMRLSDD